MGGSRGVDSNLVFSLNSPHHYKSNTDGFAISNRKGRTIWVVDAHNYGKRFIVRADEILTAFLEAERAIHEFAVDLIS